MMITKEARFISAEIICSRKIPDEVIEQCKRVWWLSKIAMLRGVA